MDSGELAVGLGVRLGGRLGGRGFVALSGVGLVALSGVGLVALSGFLLCSISSWKEREGGRGEGLEVEGRRESANNSEGVGRGLEPEVGI